MRRGRWGRKRWETEMWREVEGGGDGQGAECEEIQTGREMHKDRESREKQADRGGEREWEMGKPQERWQGLQESWEGVGREMGMLGRETQNRS